MTDNTIIQLRTTQFTSLQLFSGEQDASSICKCQSYTPLSILNYSISTDNSYIVNLLQTGNVSSLLLLVNDIQIARVNVTEAKQVVATSAVIISSVVSGVIIVVIVVLLVLIRKNMFSKEYKQLVKKGYIN